MLSFANNKLPYEFFDLLHKVMRSCHLELANH